MILKMRSLDGGWRFRDQVRSVNVGALVAHRDHPESARAFQSWNELREWVEQTYGKERDFVDEWWPAFAGDQRLADAGHVHDGVVPHGVFDSYCVRPCMATLNDGSHVLVLASQEAYLLNDQGDTIERL